MRRKVSQTVAGAVFIGDRDGNVDVYVDATRAGEALEVIELEDGEYPSAYRVDGAVLELLDVNGLVVLDPSGAVDEAGLRALIGVYARRVPVPDATSPLDFAEGWLRKEWEHERSRRPRWLHRRRKPSSPPMRTELAAPPGPPGPRLVRPWLLHEVVDEVVTALPAGAVSVVEDTSGDQGTIQLQPRAAGAVDVVLGYSLLGVDVSVAGSASIEIAAPDNVNYAPPNRFWRDDVRDVLHAVSRGQAVVALGPTGVADSVDLPGGRLGVRVHGRPRQPTTRPTAWDGPPPD